ncbi:hypothetical protein [Actinocorallia lasiicapitis]
MPHLPLAQHLQERLKEELPVESRGLVRLRPQGPDDLAEAMQGLEGSVDLLVAALPPYPGTGRGHVGVCPSCVSERRIGVPPLERLLKDASGVLRPGGHLAVITTVRHEGKGLVDPAPEVIRAAGRAGLRYVQHVIALRVPVQGDALVVQAGPEALAQVRGVRSSALPPVAVVHGDVCLFQRPVGGVR